MEEENFNELVEELQNDGRLREEVEKRILISIRTAAEHHIDPSEELTEEELKKLTESFVQGGFESLPSLENN